MRKMNRLGLGLAAAALLVMTGAAGPARAAEGGMPTVASFAEAKALAAKNHVPILVDFSAEW